MYNQHVVSDIIFFQNDPLKQFDAAEPSYWDKFHIPVVYTRYKTLVKKGQRVIITVDMNEKNRDMHPFPSDCSNPTDCENDDYDPLDSDTSYFLRPQVGKKVYDSQNNRYTIVNYVHITEGVRITDRWDSTSAKGVGEQIQDHSLLNAVVVLAEDGEIRTFYITELFWDYWYINCGSGPGLTHYWNQLLVSDTESYRASFELSMILGRPTKMYAKTLKEMKTWIESDRTYFWNDNIYMDNCYPIVVEKLLIWLQSPLMHYYNTSQVGVNEEEHILSWYKVEKWLVQNGATIKQAAFEARMVEQKQIFKDMNHLISMFSFQHLKNIFIAENKQSQYSELGSKLKLTDQDIQDLRDGESIDNILNDKIAKLSSSIPLNDIPWTKLPCSDCPSQFEYVNRKTNNRVDLPVMAYTDSNTDIRGAMGAFEENMSMKNVVTRSGWKQTGGSGEIVWNYLRTADDTTAPETTQYRFRNIDAMKLQLHVVNEKGVDKMKKLGFMLAWEENSIYISEKSVQNLKIIATSIVAAGIAAAGLAAAYGAGVVAPKVVVTALTNGDKWARTSQIFITEASLVFLGSDSAFEDVPAYNTEQIVKKIQQCIQDGKTPTEIHKIVIEIAKRNKCTDEQATSIGAKAIVLAMSNIALAWYHTTYIVKSLKSRKVTFNTKVKLREFSTGGTNYDKSEKDIKQPFLGRSPTGSPTGSVRTLFADMCGMRVTIRNQKEHYRNSCYGTVVEIKPPESLNMQDSQEQGPNNELKIQFNTIRKWWEQEKEIELGEEKEIESGEGEGEEWFSQSDVLFVEEIYDNFEKSDVYYELKEIQQRSKQSNYVDSILDRFKEQEKYEKESRAKDPADLNLNEFYTVKLGATYRLPDGKALERESSSGQHTVKEYKKTIGKEHLYEFLSDKNSSIFLYASDVDVAAKPSNKPSREMGLVDVLKKYNVTLANKLDPSVDNVPIGDLAQLPDDDLNTYLQILDIDDNDIHVIRELINLVKKKKRQTQ